MIEIIGVNEVMAFSGKAELDDDLTVLIIRILEV